MREASLKSFEKRISKAARDERKLFSVMFELNWRCNLDCQFCYLTYEERAVGEKQKPEMTTGQIAEILRQLVGEGCYQVAFTGGEIFLRKDIYEIIGTATRLGFQVTLLTSGSLLDEDAVRRLKELRVHKCSISFHAMDEAIFDRITQRPGSYRKVRRAVELLLAAGVDMELKTLGTTLNKDDVLKVNEWARSLGILHRFDGEVTTRNDGDPAPLAWSLDPEEALAIRKVTHREAYEPYDCQGRLRGTSDISRRLSPGLQKILNCGVGMSNAWIDPSGKLYLCCKMQSLKHDILKSSVKEAWQKAKEFVDRFSEADYAGHRAALETVKRSQIELKKISRPF